MKYIYVIFALLITGTSFSQIKTSNLTPPKKKVVDSIKYDSLENFIGDKVSRYVGQEFYAIGCPIENRNRHFKGFSWNNPKDRFQKEYYYPSLLYPYSTYDSLVGKYFKVLSVVKKEDLDDDSELIKSLNTNFYIQLANKSGTDTLYYEYDAKGNEHGSNFPFIVVGYFEKTRKSVIGKTYIYHNEVFDRHYKDLNNGEDVNPINLTKWKCIDYTIDEKTFKETLVIKNEKGNVIAITEWEYILR
jgi:hypothetical protein